MNPLIRSITGVVLGISLAMASAAQAADTVKIGAAQPLTGSLAPFGQASLRGMKIAVERINDSGGIKSMDGAQLEIVVGDTGSDPTTAASVAQRLISLNSVQAIFGSYASSLSIAVSQITERSRIPFLTMSFSDELTSRGFKYIFQVVAPASAMGEAQVSYAQAIAEANGEKLDSIAVLYENSAYGSSTAKGVKSLANELGIKLALFEAYPHGLTNATPLIQKIKNIDSAPDAVFPISYFTDAVLIIRAMRQNDMDLPIIGGAAGYIIPGFKEALGKYTEGIMSADTSNYDHYGEIGQVYRKRYGEFMTHEAFENAVLVYAYAQALEKAGTSDPQEVAKVLHEIRFTGYPFTGMPGGVVDFDEAGRNTETYPIMVQWQDGELKTIWPKSEATAQPVW